MNNTEMKITLNTDSYKHPCMFYMDRVLKRAHRVIFDRNIKELSEITEADFTKINGLIKNTFYFWEYEYVKAGVTKKSIPFLIKNNTPSEYTKMMLIGLSRFSYDQVKNDKNYENYFEEDKKKRNGKAIGKWYIPKKFRSQLKKIYLKNFGGTQKELFAAGIFYLVSQLSDLYNKNEIWDFGKIITDTYFLLDLTSNNALYDKKIAAEITKIHSENGKKGGEKSKSNTSIEEMMDNIIPNYLGIKFDAIWGKLNDKYSLDNPYKTKNGDEISFSEDVCGIQGEKTTILQKATLSRYIRNAKNKLKKN